jgi:predicted RND superfamily exporter protein
MTNDPDSGSFVIVGIHAPETDASRLADALRSADGVAWVIDPGFVRAASAFDDLAPEGLVVGTGGWVGVIAGRDTSIGDARLVSIACEALRLMDIEQNNTAISGPAAFHAALNEVSQRGLDRIVGAMTLLGGALIWTLTGSLRTAFASMAAASLAQITLLGIASWSGTPMSMSLSIVPPLMLAFGLSYALHRAMVGASVASIVWCAATTGVGIATFAMVDSPVIRGFGVWGAFGVAIVCIYVALLIPRGPRYNTAAPAPIARFHLTRRPLLVFAGLVLVGGLAFVPRLRFERNPIEMFPDSARIVVDSQTIEERLTGCLPFEIRTTGSFDPREAMLITPGVRAVVPALWREFESHTTIWWGLANNDSLGALATAAAELREAAQRQGASLVLGGVAGEVIALSDSVRLVALLSIPSMLAVAFVSTSIAARSVRFGLAGVFVNALPLGLVIALVAMDRAVNVADAFVGSVVIGASIDDTIHVAMAYRSTGDPARAVRSVARACVSSTLVVAACVICFALSGFPPTRAFGLMLAIGLVIALAGDLFVLPAAAPHRRW